MKKSEFEKLETEELLRKLRTLKAFTGALAGMLILLLAAAIYLSIKENNLDSSLAIAFALLSVVLINYKRIKSMKAEIKER